MSEGIQQTRIMIVDDHTSFRQPLAFMLEREQDLTVVAQAGSVAEAREVLEELEEAGEVVDLVVVDLNLPDGWGSELIVELHASRPRPLALVLSAHADSRRLAWAIESGAAGILHKSSPIEEIVDTIRRLRSGEQLIPPQEVIDAVRLVGRERLRDYEVRLLIGKLTPRERDLLKALAEGLSDKEIAERLYVGVGTVRSHMTHLLGKFGVDSRLQALVFAIRYGLVDVDRPLEDHTKP
jgi:DNA-binding NarL/FixJ family response regulator